MTTERDALAERLYAAFVNERHSVYVAWPELGDDSRRAWLRVADAALAERGGGEDERRVHAEAEKELAARAQDAYDKRDEWRARAEKGEALLQRWLDATGSWEYGPKADTRAFLNLSAATGSLPATDAGGERAREFTTSPHDDSALLKGIPLIKITPARPTPGAERDGEGVGATNAQVFLVNEVVSAIDTLCHAHANTTNGAGHAKAEARIALRDVLARALLARGAKGVGRGA